jgi:hypothetical protein
LTLLTLVVSMASVYSVANSAKDRNIQEAMTDSATDLADVIVAGEIVSGQQSGSTSAVFSLKVVRVIKGALQAGSVVNVGCQVSNWASEGGYPGEFGLWFLSETAGGQFELIPVMQGARYFSRTFLPLLRDHAPDNSNPQPATPNDSVAIEIATAMQHAADLQSWQLDDLARALFEVRNGAAVPVLYAKLAANANPEIQFFGLSGMVEMNNNASALAQLVANAGTIPTLSLLREYPLAAIASIHDTTPATISALGQLATSSGPSVQASAAQSLSNIHTLETLPSLAGLLDATDPKIQALAMRGFSSFVDNLPVFRASMVPSQSYRVPQGPTPYKTPDTARYDLSVGQVDPSREAIYVQFWKNWWATMKDQLAPQPQTNKKTTTKASPADPAGLTSTTPKR